MNTIDWANIPGKRTIKTGAGIKSYKFTTTNSKTYRGYFSAVADSGSTGLTRRMWFSLVEGGAPISQLVKSGRTFINAADVSGNEIKLSWTQADVPANPMQVVLDRNKTYYLNYQQTGNGPIQPNENSALVSGASVGGKP